MLNILRVCRKYSQISFTARTRNEVKAYCHLAENIFSSWYKNKHLFKLQQ